MMHVRRVSEWHSHRIFAVSTVLFMIVCFGNLQHVISESSSTIDTVLPQNPYTQKQSQEHKDLTKKKALIPLRHQYCEYPQDGFYKTRGLYPPGYNLEKVSIVMSSGKLLTNDTEHLSLAKHSCHYEDHITEQHSVKINEYLDVINMYKPLNKYTGGFKYVSMVPQDRACSSVHSSPASIIHSIQLGEDMGQVYQELFRGTDPKHTAKYVHALSNQNTISFQTTMAFLYGILPEKHFSYAHTQKTSANFCSSVKDRSFSCRCHKLDYLEEYVKNAFEKGRHLLKNTFDDVSQEIKQLLGLKPDFPISANELLVYFVTNMCNGIGKVCDKANSSVDVLRLLSNISHNYFDTLVLSPVIQSFSRLYAYPLLRMMAKGWKDTYNDSTKLLLYSSDNFFFSNLLVALNIVPQHDIFLPQSFVIEVYKNSHEYLFQVLYNGRNVTGDLVICQNHLVNKFCKLDVLISFISQKGGLLPSSTYQEACQL